MTFISRLFNSSGASDNEVADLKQARADGYTDYNAKVICAFQQAIEARGCDYTALAETLQFARSINDYKLTPVGLQAHYNEASFGWLFSK